MNNHSFKFHFDIFPSPLVLIFADSLEDCSKIAKKSYDLEISYSNNALAITQLINGYVVIALTHSTYIDRPSYLIHEALHAAYEILRNIGADTSYNNQECIAYLQQYIYDRCDDALKNILKHNVKNKS